MGITGLAALLLAWGVSAISQQRFVDDVAHDLITLSAPLQAQAPGWSFIRAITGGAADPVRSPSGVAVAPDGRIYVIDTARDQIQVLDAAGQPVTAWGESGSDPGQFWFSVSDGADLALAPDGSLVVIDPANNRVQQFTSDGTLLRTWGRLGSDPGTFLDPYGVAVDRDGRIYVADGNHRIQVFDHDGRFLAEWDGTKGGDTPLAGPVGVAVAPDGTIWVTDDILQRVIGFHPDGTVAAAFGSIGDQPGQVRGPWGIAVDAAGLLYVAENGNDRVQVFAPDGTSVAILGTAGTAAGTLAKPTYVAFGPEGTLFVSSAGTHRLQEFRIIADDKER
ncbi:MAG: NHL repeat-containing protein [Thermomicrobiales bacterium]